MWNSSQENSCEFEGFISDGGGGGVNAIFQNFAFPDFKMS